MIKLFSARESLVSDIPAGDVKDDNLFLQCSLRELFRDTVPLKVLSNGARGGPKPVSIDPF